MISIIVAVAANGVIGVGGRLPWHLSGDLQFFKRVTMGKAVIMGRKSWESLPIKPLPGRTNIIVTRQDHFRAKGALVAANIDEALSRAKETLKEGETQEICVIGGAEIYRQFLPRSQRIYLTEVSGRPAGDTFFPPFDGGNWQQVCRIPQPVKTGQLDYAFVIMERKI